MRCVRIGLGLAGLLIVTATAAAQSPVAIVEDVSDRAAGVEFMDYVAKGKVIKLSGGGKLVLGYLKSCWRETITGATVTVEFEKSRVQGGNVDREKVACDAGRMQLTAETASKGGAMVFREVPTGGKPSPLSLRPQSVPSPAEHLPCPFWHMQIPTSSLRASATHSPWTRASQSRSAPMPATS